MATHLMIILWGKAMQADPLEVVRVLIAVSVENYLQWQIACSLVFISFLCSLLCSIQQTPPLET
jgi:hypothetical protein